MGEKHSDAAAGSSVWERLRPICRAFWDDWTRLGTQPKLEDYLRRAAEADRPRLLVRLVRRALERRLKAEEAARVEEYLPLLDRYPPPEPGGRDAVILEWIEREYELRRRREPTLTRAEYAARFPEYAGKVEERLTLAFPPPAAVAAVTCKCACPRCQANPLKLVDDPAAGGKACAACGRRLDYLGKYLILREVGHGGFGAVHEAYDPVLQRAVALKVARPDRFDSRDATESFLAEAQKAAGLKHGGIVPVYEFGVDAGRPYIVSQFVRGDSLRQRIGRGSLPHEQVVGLVAAVAEALRHLHQAGFVHRDIKPENILLDEDEQPYLTDFGLAVHEAELLRERGWVAGTLAYMAPEQLRGEADRCGPWTDLYSLGVVMYELLSGRLPFAAQDRDELREQILHQEPWPPSAHGRKTPRRLERICMNLISRQPEGRYRTAGELAADLRPRRIPRPALVSAGAVALLLVVLPLAVGLWPRTPPPPAPYKKDEVPRPHGGLEITEVLSPSHAARIGLKPRDVLLEIDGEPLTMRFTFLEKARTVGPHTLVYWEKERRRVRRAAFEVSKAGELFGVRLQRTKPEGESDGP